MYGRQRIRCFLRASRRPRLPSIWRKAARAGLSCYADAAAAVITKRSDRGLFQPYPFTPWLAGSTWDALGVPRAPFD